MRPQLDSCQKGRGGRSPQSGRGGRAPPPTPPYVRFRIRRFPLLSAQCVTFARRSKEHPAIPPGFCPLPPASGPLARHLLRAVGKATRRMATGSALHPLVRQASMASADFSLRPAWASPFQASGEISQGKTRDLPPIYPPHILPHLPGWLSGFGSCGLLAQVRLPPMQFLFVGPGVCLQLPSDAGSPRLPLLFS